MEWSLVSLCRKLKKETSPERLDWWKCGCPCNYITHLEVKVRGHEADYFANSAVKILVLIRQLQNNDACVEPDCNEFIAL